MEQTKIIIYGCGVMGLRVAETLSKKKSFAIVGAIDIDPELVGKNLGSLLEGDHNMDISIQNDPIELFNTVDADAVVLTTLSHLKEVFPQIDQCIQADLNVVSTCKELSYPWDREPELAIDPHSSLSRSPIHQSLTNDGLLEKTDSVSEEDWNRTVP